jgi:hypothetical protein
MLDIRPSGQSVRRWPSQREPLRLAAALASGLVAGLVLSTFMWAHPSGFGEAHPAPAPRSSSDPLAEHQSLVRTIDAATMQHDYRALALARQRLRVVTTPELLGQLYARFEALSRKIESAEARHDTRARHLFSAELAQLCRTEGPVALLPECQAR